MNKKKPVVVIALIAINVLVFLILDHIGDTTSAEFMFEHGAVYPDSIYFEGQYWRLITATFMHFGIQHIMNNMILLGCSGIILEDALGHVKFTILYLLAGIGGSALSYFQMLYSGEYAVSAGASGAIFGIIGALLWIVIRHKGKYESLTGKGLLFMIALSIYYGIQDGEIDNWGHIGGLIAGFILCMILYRKRSVNIDFDEENQYTY